MASKHSWTRFIFILVDGSPYQVFDDLVQDGTLQNIKKYVIDRGVFKKAVTAFPSTTGPAFIPFFTGQFPGSANIPGIRWLSKKQFQNSHQFRSPGICSYMGMEGLSFSAHLPNSPTLFDFFSPVNNIYNILTCGCPPSGDLTRRIKPLVYTYAHFSERWRFVNAIACRKLLKAVRGDAKFIMCLFPAVDTFSHLSDTRSSNVIEVYQELDRTVGEVCQILQASKEFDNTLIMITSDHGMSNTHTHIDLPRHLDSSGWRCLHYPLLWRRRTRSASMVSGNGMTHLYFKGGGSDKGWNNRSTSKVQKGWGERLPFERLSRSGVLQSLLEIEGLAFIAGQNEDGAIIVQNRTGLGKITCEDETFSYQFQGRDPLGYGVYYQNLSYRDALIQTYESEYPDGLVQLWQIFQGDRTGNLVLSADPGYDLRARYEYPEHHATHGALNAEQMFVPLAINLPIETGFIRTVDLFPTVLSQFGCTVGPSQIDGQILC